MLVADVTDAFWLIPLHAKERKYFVAKLRGSYYVFTRTAQGSRAAPLMFAAILSTAARWVASAERSMRLQVYVDDPLAIIKGTEAEQKRTACLVVVMWSIMGFPIATNKAVLASSLVWIGVRLQIHERTVVAEVPESKVAELDMLLADSLKPNVISKKNLRTLIGKAMAMAYGVSDICMATLRQRALHGPTFRAVTRSELLHLDKTDCTLSAMVENISFRRQGWNSQELQPGSLQPCRSRSDDHIGCIPIWNGWNFTS